MLDTQEGFFFFYYKVMSAINIVISVVLVLIAVVFLSIAFMLVRKKTRQPTNLLGCRVKYVDSNGTSFGYVSHDKGDKVIVQNPWKKFETVPILKERVQPVRKEDWNNAIHPETGNSIWAVETESSTDEMFKFYDMSPKTCV